MIRTWPLFLSALPSCQPDKSRTPLQIRWEVIDQQPDPTKEEEKGSPNESVTLVPLDAGNQDSDSVDSKRPEPVNHNHPDSDAGHLVIDTGMDLSPTEPDSGEPPVDSGHEPPNELILSPPENFGCEVIDNGEGGAWAAHCTWDRYQTDDPEGYNYKLERRFNNGNYEHLRNIPLSSIRGEGVYDDWHIIPGIEYQYRIRLEHRPPLIFSEWRENDPLLARVRPEYTIQLESEVIHGETSTEAIYDRYSQCLDPAAPLFDYNLIEGIEYFEGNLCQQNRHESPLFRWAGRIHSVTVSHEIGTIHFTEPCGGYIGDVNIGYFQLTLTQQIPDREPLDLLDLHIFPERNRLCWAVWNAIPTVDDQNEEVPGKCLLDSERFPAYRPFCQSPYSALLYALALNGLSHWEKLLQRVPDFTPEVFGKAVLIIALAVAVVYLAPEIAEAIGAIAGAAASFGAMAVFVDANDLRDRGQAMLEFIQRTFATLTPESDAFDDPDEPDTHIIIRDVEGIPDRPLAINEQADINVTFRNVGQAGMFNYRFEEICNGRSAGGSNEATNIYIPKNAEIIKHRPFMENEEGECQFVISAITDPWEDENLDVQGTVTDSRSYDITVQRDEEDCHLVIESAEMEGGWDKRIGDELVMDVRLRNAGGRSQGGYQAFMWGPDNGELDEGCSWVSNPFLIEHNEIINRNLRGCFADERGQWTFMISAVCDAASDGQGLLAGRFTDNTGRIISVE